MKKIVFLILGFLLIGVNLYAGDLIVDGKVGIGTVTPEFKLTLDNDGGIIAKGIFGSGATLTPTEEEAKLIWYPRKAAFRAGYVEFGAWNDEYIGNYSIAGGYNTCASGVGTTAVGYGTCAGGFGSLVSGSFSSAYGYVATAIGRSVSAVGVASVAIGDHVNAYGDNAIVLGEGIGCTGPLDNHISSSLMVGFYSDIPTLFVGPSSGAGTTGNVGIATTTPTEKLEVAGKVKAQEFVTGDITFQKDGEKLWRMFEDENGLYIESIKTGKVYKFVLQEVDE